MTVLTGSNWVAEASGDTQYPWLVTGEDFENEPYWMTGEEFHELLRES